jgi:hypothetical protein
LTRLRLGVLLALAAAFGAFSHAPEAMAAAEVHRLNLVLSGNPSQVDGGGMNDLLDRYNQYPLQSRGFEGLEQIGMGWFFDAELRYFVRPNFALAAGVGQLKIQTKREFLPSIGSAIDVRGEVVTAPLHVGAQYYLAPYNQGDFQARAFLGGGLLSLAATQARFTTFEMGLPMSGDTLDIASLGGTNRLVATGEGMGYYAELGAHMFFAARYSVIVGAIYRSARIRDMANEGMIMVPQDRPVAPYLQMPLLGKDGKPVRISSLDVSGVGVRMALGIGF